ncbi:MAG TPA: SPFH domain-containing protein [Cyclobacteriaceae bacterium]|nr:SPFH domain-containing protein [Cyclobacteriaceae bacterium]HMV10835.1 SPFH domain-containing protein [Cyclobacteriaceae bacterium]HMV90634.1 SPFH domain-containing protein [Cyclobacteriaceae bacterium]HMX02636.1 SPFH domain-containing protein [Cyclobacteriaceae bacterium]HMX50865.1 SPFH domain-containing protein [Cyclobacteriaceae bacterium]
MNQEKTSSPVSGYLMLTVVLLLLVLGTLGLIVGRSPIFIWPLVIGFVLMMGFFFINPNSSVVLVLFGSYQGTVKKNGFYWVNPFYVKKPISLRARNFDSEKIKVNDKVGNPIQIGVILVWQVQDTFKAAFDVDNYENFVKVQSDSAVRKLAGEYAYDNFEEDSEVTLRSGHEEVNQALEENLRKRLEIAGIQVIEARIGYLAYAPEIASAMLRRQQATAVVSARFKIVEGAVSMVQMALDHLSKQNIIELDEERKAAMVSNLMVVLCSDKDVSPVVNTGTLHQ